METIYDWVTVAIFAGLIVLFLQRSMDENSDDSIIPYLGAGVGCAVANYLGNNEQPLFAILVIAAVVGFIIVYLKPFPIGKNPS